MMSGGFSYHAGVYDERRCGLGQRGLLAPAPLGKVFTLQPEKNAAAFFRKFWLRLRKGVDGKLFFAPQKTAVPY